MIDTYDKVPNPAQWRDFPKTWPKLGYKGYTLSRHNFFINAYQYSFKIFFSPLLCKVKTLWFILAHTPVMLNILKLIIMLNNYKNIVQNLIFKLMFN